MRISLPYAWLLVLSACCARFACLQPALAGGLSAWRPPAANGANATFSGTWRAFGASLEGRPLQLAHWGSGQRAVLVIGPLAGDRPEGLGVIDKLAAYLTNAKLVPGVRVLVVRDPNPDGRARGWPFNARAVDLDANFPTAGWRKTPRADRWSSGRVPQSEPETRAVVRILREIRPQRVVFIASGARRNSIGYLGAGETIARQAAAAADLPLWAFDVASHAASCPAYAQGELNLPVVLLMCRPHASADENWQALYKSILVLLELEPYSDARADTSVVSDVWQRDRGQAEPVGQGMADNATKPAISLRGNEPMIDVQPAQPLSEAGLGTATPRLAESGDTQPVRFAASTDVLVKGGQPASKARSAPHERPSNRASGERLRYLLPFTSAARRARESRMAELLQLAQAELVTAVEDAAAAEDGRLMPVVSPRAARGLFCADFQLGASRGDAVLAGPPIEPLPPVGPPEAADALASARQTSDGPPERYPSTAWPD